MSNPITNFANYPPAKEAEIMAPVLVDDLKAAWVYCREMGKQKQTRLIPKPEQASLPVAIRCNLLEQILNGAEPTDAQFAAMAEMPLDGSVPKEEFLKRLGV